MTEEIKEFLRLNDVDHKGNISLAKISPVKIGGVADLVIYPRDIDRLILTIDYLICRKIKYKILGRMSNLLFPDEKIQTPLIMTRQLKRIYADGEYVCAECGASLREIALLAADMGLGGMEGLHGIPGSIGGSIVNNSGAFGYEISKVLSHVMTYDLDKKRIEKIKGEECNFGYRRSVFQNASYIILSAKLRFFSKDLGDIKEEIKRCRDGRCAAQPTDMPSLGSAFKRPSADVSAAKLIDECGLRGHSIGGAQISEKHAGFIVNKGGASAKDYKELLVYTRNKVAEKFGIYLEKEVEFL